MTLTYAITWARMADNGDYLVTYDEAMGEDERCGFGDDEIDAIKTGLSRRGLRLVADDYGLVAQAVVS